MQTRFAPLPANAHVSVKLQVRRGPLDLPMLLPRVVVSPRGAVR